jgi:hypothetical protein
VRPLFSDYCKLCGKFSIDYAVLPGMMSVICGLFSTFMLAVRVQGIGCKSCGFASGVL